MKNKQSGFTLIEIAIVLVIIGLLLGGILKGQEMITSGQVRNMISQSDGVTAAVFAFQDRYRAIPGDYAAATTNMPGGGATANGNGNGQIDTSAEAGDAWQHLALAGFISGTFNGADTGITQNWGCASVTCPSNAFGGPMLLTTDDESSGTSINGLELYSGQNVPIGVMLEIDTKIDDGIADRGTFRLSDSHTAACDDGSAAGISYNVAGAPTATCGGVFRNF